SFYAEGLDRLDPRARDDRSGRPRRSGAIGWQTDRDRFRTGPVVRAGQWKRGSRARRAEPTIREVDADDRAPGAGRVDPDRPRGRPRPLCRTETCIIG